MGFAFKIDVITVDAGQLVVALLKELGRDLREHGVREHVLLLHDILAGFRLQLLDLRLQQICQVMGCSSPRICFVNSGLMGAGVLP